VASVVNLSALFVAKFTDLQINPFQGVTFFKRFETNVKTVDTLFANLSLVNQNSQTI